MSFEYEFCIFNGNRIYIKTIIGNKKKEKKHDQIVMLAVSKVNSIESPISKALIVYEISNENFTKVINEESSYSELKESIRMMKRQRSDI